MSTESPWIRMPSNRDNVCNVCNHTISESTMIYWNKQNSLVRHDYCHENLQLTLPQSFDPGSDFVRNGKIFRHGDLLIREINKIPSKAKPIDTKTLAEGEVTGHTHKLEGNCQIFEHLTTKFLEILEEEEAKLVHEEHKMIKIPKGKYVIINEREYNPWENETSRVVD